MTVRRHRSALAVVALTVVSTAVTACGADDTCRSLAVSLARTTGGADSAVAAARDLAASGDFGLPDGWVDGPADVTGRDVTSGRTTVHAVRGTDGTWFVDSGRCA